MSKIKIVARFTDGRILKGTTDNFSPSEPSFHLTLFVEEPSDAPADAAAAATTEPHIDPSKPICVQVRDLKAVFVVREFGGNPKYKDRKEFGESQGNVGTKLQIRFHDGETMFGHSMNFDLTQQGFFLFPADPNSNNQRIYVISQAVKAVDRVA